MTVASKMSNKLLDLKAAYLSSAMDSLWRQISWREVAITSVRDGSELFDFIAKNCYMVTEVEKVYEQYYKDFHQIRIPFTSGSTFDIRDYPTYTSGLDAMESDAAVGVEMIVQGMLNQVAKRASSASASGNSAESTGPAPIVVSLTSDDGETKKEVIAHLDTYFEKAMAHLSLTEFAPESMSKSLTACENKSYVVVLDVVDDDNDTIMMMTMI